MHRLRITASRLAFAAMAAGALLITASLFFTPLSDDDRGLYRIGFVAVVLGATAYVSSRVRKLTADDIERARQEGYDEGRADAFAVQPELVDLNSRRAAVAERRAAQ